MHALMISIALGAAVSVATPSLAAAEAKKAASMAACMADLERGTGPDIVCEFPLQPSAAERAEMEKQTSGLLKNAVCTVSVNIARALISTAINTPDHVFQTPPQPMSCRVTTPGKTADVTTDVTGTFAPKITFKGGIATDATPGLGNVKGVSQIISWPAVAYINRAGFLQQGMVKSINAWVEHMRRKPGTAAPK